MKLHQKHKKFAVKYYAKFMKTTDVIDAFIILTQSRYHAMLFKNYSTEH